MKLIDLVIVCVKNVGKENNNDELLNASCDTSLYGIKGNLDSLSLVSLIADLEQKVSETFGKNVVLADDRAMSQRHSPFRSVQILANYIQQLLDEDGA